MRIPILDRYLLRELVSPFSFGVALFTFFLMIDRLYHLTDLIITKGVPIHLVLQLLLFMLPSFAPLILPMALLISVLLAGGRLAGDLEIVAFKAAGVSILRLFRPVFFASVLISVVAGALILWIIPFTNQLFQKQLFRILQARAITGLQERIFNTTFGDVVIYVEEVGASQTTLRGLLISDERDPKISRIITAAHGRLLADEEAHRVTLRLFDGAVHEGDTVPTTPPVLPKGELPPRGGAAGDARYRVVNFTVYDMSLSLDSPLRDPRGQKPEKDMTLATLLTKIKNPGEEDMRMRLAYGDDARMHVAYLIELHKRFALSVAPLVFTLLAFPLAVRSHRSGRSLALIASLVILLVYHLLSNSLENAALNLRISAWIAAWTPGILFTLAGVLLLTAVVREWSMSLLAGIFRATTPLMKLIPLPSPGARGSHEVANRNHSRHILDWYVLREFMSFIGIGLAVASTLFIIVDLLQTLDRYLRVKPPLIFIVEHFVYRLPIALHDGLPVVILVATIFLFLSLSRFHELTAMKAAGISLYRISAPVLLIGLAIAIIAGIFQEFFIPRLNELGEDVDRVKIRGQLPRALESRQRMWLRASDSRFFRVELMSPTTSDLYGLTILEVDRQLRLVDRLDAKHARWTPKGWYVAEGVIRQFERSGEIFAVPFVGSALELQQDIGEFTRVQRRIDSMSYSELSDYIARLDAAGFEVKRYLVQLYSKVSFPLVNLIMIVVAIPLALQAPRGGRVFGVGLAIAIMAGYLITHYVALALARADLLPPLIAAWTANIIFAGLGTSLFLRART